MGELLQIGMGIGFLLGLAHGVHVYRRLTARPYGTGVLVRHMRGLYYGLWALALWIVFGPYVVAIWTIGGLAYLGHRFRRSERQQPVPGRGEAL